MSRFSIDLHEVSDKREVIPAGDYPIRIVKGEIATGSFKNKKDEDRNYIRLTFTAVVKDDDVAALLKQDEPKCFPSVFVSFDSDWNLLEQGNEAFGKFRKALGFNSWDDFLDGTSDDDSMEDYSKKVFSNMAEAAVGADLLAKIGTRTYNDELQNEVKSLAALAE